ncbi:MAG TPA: hypothetical protein VMJ34_17660 [Bryobacteraceae bacterium]|nr:hypothetical protein [Bryobacteraceae bacterium]
MRGLMLFVTMVACSGLAWAAPARVDVHVCQQAEVPAAELAGAEKEAAYLLGEAGVSVNWLGCTWAEGDHPAAPVAEVVLLIRERSPWQVPDGRQVCGAALIDHDRTGTYGLAFYDETRRLALKGTIDTDIVLAYVIAHEIGHLAGLRHGPTGIMRPQWGEHEMELMKKHWLGFTVQERSVLTAALASRVEAQTSAGPAAMTGEPPSGGLPQKEAENPAR